MIPMMMIGMAAMLFTFGIIMMQIGSLKEAGVLANIGVGLVFLIDLLVCALLIMGAISS
jgi:hypothetical protein